MTLSLEKIAELIGATLVGNPSIEIKGINTLKEANKHQLTYAVSNKYSNSLANTKAVGSTIALDEVFLTEKLYCLKWCDILAKAR